jgi:2-amino-4-hydroxy-6-hydroxymethyldihydropteridine diphosphokinase
MEIIAASESIHKIYLGLGSNLGNKEENLKKALDLLSQKIGDIIAVSSFYTSEPQGFISENSFLNAVVSMHTKLLPFALLDETRKIEKQLGRKQKTQTTYTDRIIDIDILFYDDLILNTPELTIPHPHIAEREFVFVPLSEIASELVSQKFGKIKKNDIDKPI